MKKRVLAVLSIGFLMLSLLAGCDEDWDEEEYDEAETGYVTSTETAGEAMVETYAEAPTDRSGLIIEEVESSLDPNPKRAVRRSTTPIQQVVETKLDGTPVPSDFYMYRATWSEKYQKAYDQICQALTNGESEIVMSVTVNNSDIGPVYFSVLYDHPELFYVKTKFKNSYNNNGYVTTITPEYYSSDIQGMIGEMNNSVNQALADMWSLGSDIERVKYAHDYICNRITYTHNDMDQSGYAGLVLGKCVCAGYAQSFCYMMHKMGIPCALVVGDAGGNHAWNILKLDNDYYMMDITWDDPDNGNYSYNYFNITSAQIQRDHTIGQQTLEISKYLPVAYGTAYNFQNAFNGNAYGTDFNAIKGTMPQQATDVAGNGSGNGAGDGYDDGYDYGYGNDDYGYGNDDYDYGNGYGYGNGYTDTYTYGTTTDSGWWNLMDSSWTKDDWEYDSDYDEWFIYDDETGFYYIYSETYDIFGTSTPEGDAIYWLDMETGEWILQE